MSDNPAMTGVEVLVEGDLYRDDTGVLHAEGFTVRFPNFGNSAGTTLRPAEGYKADLDIGIAVEFFKALAEERGI